MAESIIQVKNLSVIYNEGQSNEVRALEKVTTEIFPQEYVIIHGPSGCGKSTLLYTIAGLQIPTHGEVIVNGKNIAQMKNSELVEFHRSGEGIIFQAFYLISSLNIIDNVCLPQVFRGENLKKRREKGMLLLQRFGIAEQAYKFPGQLSGGQKQRVAIARALVNDPQIILADEPVGNLDSKSAQNFLELVKELNEVDKKTIILVTHNDEHLHYADRVINMRDGQIVNEEVNKEKRSKEAVQSAQEAIKEGGSWANISDDLKMLMRMFRGLNPQQVGALLIPFKAGQLISHVLSELSEEQVKSAENFLKELLFRNIDLTIFEKNLDLPFEEGGANWNKRRSKSLTLRIKAILDQVQQIGKNPDEAAASLADYLIKFFGLNLSEKGKLIFISLLKLRLENKTDYSGLRKILDAPPEAGGMGLYKNTAEKIVREIEVIMLLKYSA
jgi:putative ABC transport system ATP-binding protein